MQEPELTQAELSDETLVERVARRDVAAVTLLYDRYARPIYALAAHMLGGAEAEEVVQESFLRLWNKAEQFDGARGPFAGWFMAIARNQMLDRLRRRAQQQRLESAAAVEQVLAAAPDPKVDVEEEVWQRQRAAVLLRALEALPAEQRRVLVLAYFGGLSQSSISRQLDCPLGTVKKRIRLGMQKLRASLTNSELAMEGAAERE